MVKSMGNEAYAAARNQTKQKLAPMKKAFIALDFKAIHADLEHDADSEVKEILLMEDPICGKHHF